MVVLASIGAWLQCARRAGCARDRLPGAARRATVLSPILDANGGLRSALRRSVMTETRECPKSRPTRLCSIEHHIFLCTNSAAEGHPRGSCNARAAGGGVEKLRAYAREKAQQLGIENIRCNAAGCLDRCEFGPNMVIYPEGVWYRYENHGRYRRDPRGARQERRPGRAADAAARTSCRRSTKTRIAPVMPRRCPLPRPLSPHAGRGRVERRPGIDWRIFPSRRCCVPPGKRGDGAG